MAYTNMKLLQVVFIFGEFGRSILHSCYSLNNVCGRHKALRPQSNTSRNMFYFMHANLDYLDILKKL